MKRIIITIYLILPFTKCLLPDGYAQASASEKSSHEIADYVNPFIGTGGHGHTFPGPTLPFGACQVGPDTRLSGWDGCSGYHYSDSIIYGFSHTHLSGTGCSDYGDILLMPLNKETQLDDYQYKSKFSHSNEKASAGYYQVYLEDHQINVELTSTLHGGVHRYTYQNKDDKYVVLDLKHRDEVIDSKMEKVDDYTLQGYRFSKAWAKNQKVYYRIKFSAKIENIQYEPVKSGSQTSVINLDKSLHCIIKFQKEESSSLLVKVSISGVDEQGAEKNMSAEMPHWDFEKYTHDAVTSWEHELSKIQISETATDKLVIFYTALYHCMIHPSLYSDVDGRYRGRDDKIHNTEGKFDYYTVFSLWDTYRALHPLLTIIDTKRTNDFINTFIKQYEQGGRLPIWELSSNETNCMIGYHVVSVIWDAYHKGIRNYDADKAFEAMKSIATYKTDYMNGANGLSLKAQAREHCADADALESYCKFGYVRADDSHESVSKTLEYAYNDWCIAQMAKALGKEKDYEYYFNRSLHWMNVYDPTTGFMRARKNSTLYEPFSPYTVDNNFTEANSWQYSFYVPHDVVGLIQLHGGNKKFEYHLDSLFTAKTKTEGREQADITGLIGQYAHGNEPSHNLVYLYNYIGKRGKMIKLIDKICDSFYTNNPDGLIGNEDCGQMSAWYVLSKMGLYPSCPGELTYDDNLHKDQTIKIFGEKLNPTKEMISATLGINETTISKTNRQCISNITNQKQTGIKQISLNEKKNVGDQAIISNPFITKAGRIFKHSQEIAINSLQKQNKIFYSLNDAPFQAYKKPIPIFTTSTIQFFTKNKSGQSPTQIAGFTKLPDDRHVILKSTYNKSYGAGGAEAMFDNIYGKLNWRAGDWQGYQGQDVEIIIWFDKPKTLKSISANFLEDQNSWIFYPKQVSFFASNDSLQWTLIETIPTNKSEHDEKVSISRFAVHSKTPIPVTKFYKMLAKNFGPMPQWHEGRGNETFIFIDEFELK